MRLEGFFAAMNMSNFSGLNLKKVFPGVVLPACRPRFRAFMFSTHQCHFEVECPWEQYWIPCKSEIQIVFLDPAPIPVACAGNFR